MPANITDLSHAVPPVPTERLLTEIKEKLSQSAQSIVVLDDDPTGTQTVYGVPVLTEWSSSIIALEFRLHTPLFFILTNSRSLPAREAESLAFTIGENLRRASVETGRSFKVISRSDSTLRGHYPIEVDALLKSLEQEEAIRIIAPAFFEGGRYTYQDIQYVQEDNQWIPVGETPFAQDKTFGFHASHLKKWVEEKTQGKVKAEQVYSFGIDLIRTASVEELIGQLEGLPPASSCVINALAPYDLEKIVLALMSLNRPVLYRTAASFVTAMAGLAPRPLLNPKEITGPQTFGGLTVVGSYVPKSSKQLQSLLNSGLVNHLELPVDSLQDLSQRADILCHLTNSINHLLFSGQDIVLYTSRELRSGSNKEESLWIGKQISRALTEIVAGLLFQPRYFIAKGGITSSDLATNALNVRKALVLGQLIPGVPVWQLGEESRYPGMCYVIFPGNVGNNDSLREIVKKMGRRQNG